MSTQVVLGATGVAGRETVAALRARDLDVRTVSRSEGGPAHIAADLRDPAATARAIRGAEVAYLTAGLPYSTRVWRRDWPAVVGAAIDGCLATGARLVYLDNVYAYGRTDAPMTEATPIRPSSRKGEVRAGLLGLLERARTERGLDVTIGRSADFYGPGASTSVFNMFAVDAIAAGRQPRWLFDANLPHSMTYTVDVGRGLAVLGTDERARGRAWHLPTAPALTGAEYLALAGGAAVGTGRPRLMSAATMRFGAIFSSAARETLEMAYQFTAPYRFDSSAFERTFGIQPTPYADGIAASVAAKRAGAPAL
jgi:nucleoside-diphosphate-sugar epimerase